LYSCAGIGSGNMTRGPDGRRIPYRPRQGVKLSYEDTPNLLDAYYAPAAFPGTVMPRLRLLWRTTIPERKLPYLVDWEWFIEQLRVLGLAIRLEDSGFATVAYADRESYYDHQEAMRWLSERARRINAGEVW
ncbi:MAG: hypothetical protein ACREDE_11720, partial [Thermoplasmata archaeon]